MRDIERYCTAELRGLYPEGEVRAFLRILFEAFVGWNTTDLLLHRDDTVNQSVLLQFHWAVEDLKRFRPIQHIVGYTTFCDCHIEVNEDVLIPRPETEQLVERIVQLWSTAPSQITDHRSQITEIIDLCTGSGCIAIALAQRFPQAAVTAVDVSSKALQVAQRNASNNNVKIHFLHADVLHDFTVEHNSFDLLVSNPPYVCHSEQDVMAPNVLNYEPHGALFVPDSDPLLFYRSIADFAAQHNVQRVALEINEHFATQTAALYDSKGFATRIENDFRDRPRFLFGQKK